ncbi:MAG: hypothetical protein V3U98_08075 [Acidobacteriota bacterium]
MKLSQTLILTLVALSLGCVHTRGLLEDAWQEANRRAGRKHAEASPPEVRWRNTTASAQCEERVASGPRTAARYLPGLDRVEILSTCSLPIHTLLVHEFLHAIHERERRDLLGDLAGTDPAGERWVQERAAAR